MNPPSVTKAINQPFKREGVILVPVERSTDIEPKHGCDGCYYCDACHHRLACSKFDRKDDTSVWFKEVKNL